MCVDKDWCVCSFALLSSYDRKVARVIDMRKLLLSWFELGMGNGDSVLFTLSNQPLISGTDTPIIYKNAMHYNL